MLPQQFHGNSFHILLCADHQSVSAGVMLWKLNRHKGFSVFTWCVVCLFCNDPLEIHLSISIMGSYIRSVTFLCLINSLSIKVSLYTCTYAQPKDTELQFVSSSISCTSAKRIEGRPVRGEKIALKFFCWPILNVILHVYVSCSARCVLSV